MLPTKTEALAKLTAAFPGVEFIVKRGSYAQGTNYSRDVLEVSYNYRRNALAPQAVSAVLPSANVWARGI